MNVRLEQQPLEKAACGRSTQTSNEQPHHGERHALANDEPLDVAPRRAEREANANLSRALRDAKGEDTVEPDCCQ